MNRDSDSQSIRLGFPYQIRRQIGRGIFLAAVILRLPPTGSLPPLIDDYATADANSPFVTMKTST